MALAFDEVDPDSPTFEAHALPSDPAILAALPLANEEQQGAASGEPQSRRAAEEDERETLPALPDDGEEEPVPQSRIPTVPPMSRGRRRVAPVVATFAALFVIAAALAAVFWR